MMTYPIDVFEKAGVFFNTQEDNKQYFALKLNSFD